MRNKILGRPRVGTDDDPVVQLNIIIRRSQLDHLATIDRNISKAVRAVIDQHRKGNDHDQDIHRD